MKRLTVVLALFAMVLTASAASLSVVPNSLSIEVVVKATVDSFTAKLGTADVVLAGDPATGAFTTAEVKFAWADLKTGKDARDKEMLKWAGAETHPGGRFVLAKIERSGDGTFTVTGALELAGQTHDLSFPVKIAQSTAGWTVSGETKLDHRTWGLPKIRKMAVLSVDPVVTVRFSFEAAAPTP